MGSMERKNSNYKNMNKKEKANLRAVLYEIVVQIHNADIDVPTGWLDRMNDWIHDIFETPTD